jgi:hypothetical protein
MMLATLFKVGRCLLKVTKNYHDLSFFSLIPTTLLLSRKILIVLWKKRIQTPGLTGSSHSKERKL